MEGPYPRGALTGGENRKIIQRIVTGGVREETCEPSRH